MVPLGVPSVCQRSYLGTVVTKKAPFDAAVTLIAAPWFIVVNWTVPSMVPSVEKSTLSRPSSKPMNKAGEPVNAIFAAVEDWGIALSDERKPFDVFRERRDQLEGVSATVNS